MKCNVLYSVVYNCSINKNCSNGVSNGSSLRIKPFRLLKIASMFITNLSLFDRIALKRDELKLTVFTFVFCILQLGFIVL